ncbi:MAG: hypothetical protein KAS11_00430 [Candidatus Aenigmarchaeota archaeon]|nr:hypothetical protein [Candidatus Aenigmarchaeota archaeon]
MIKKREIQESGSYLLEIISAYEGRGHETVSLDKIRQTALALQDNGLQLYNNYNDRELESKLNMFHHDMNYLTCSDSRYSLTDSGRKFLDESIIPIADNKRRIFYDTIDNIPSKS